MYNVKNLTELGSCLPFPREIKNYNLRHENRWTDSKQHRWMHFF